MFQSQSEFSQRVSRQAVEASIPNVQADFTRSEFAQRVSRQAVEASVPNLQADFEHTLNRAKGGGSPLDHAFRAKVEPAMGADFSGVKVHTDNDADQLSKSIQAKAFTTGNDIFFKKGEYEPGSQKGQELLAHELTHVVQQSSGIRQKDSFKTVSNSISTVTQPQISMDRETATTEVDAELIGHASPRWEHRRGASREELNLNLSQDRVTEVETYFREIFTRRMADRGTPIFNFTNECIDVDVAEEGSLDSASMTSSAVGDTGTLEEAGGNVKANAPSMRRVDVGVSLTWHISGEAPFTEAVTHPEECAPNATNQWSIKMAIGGGAGHAGLGGAFAIGRVKNRLTGQEAEGSFVGGGIGIGLQTPGANPGWGDWVDFTSEDVCTLEDFDGTLARLTSAGAGIGLIGYSLAWISFPMRGANAIYVGGFNMGALGADAGSNVGTWNVHGTPPGPQCEPEHTTAVTNYAPYEYSVPHQYSHRVLFETGSSTMSDESLQQLELFVDNVLQNYDFPRQETSEAEE
ncbi:MAG: DUF4157 domain-containing protein [Moorea sp. SIO2B7]|nr:DUF4157 domain-containing protein [Moorena sp. SIO2B7]